MKASTSATNQSDQTSNEGVYSAILSSGREVQLRGMKTKDLVFMEKQGSARGKSETERTMSMIERLSQDPKITVPELQELSLPDFRTLTELMGKAGGVDVEEDMDEDA